MCKLRQLFDMYQQMVKCEVHLKSSSSLVNQEARVSFWSKYSHYQVGHWEETLCRLTFVTMLKEELEQN